jgi:hypothetical protein
LCDYASSPARFADIRFYHWGQNWPWPQWPVMKNRSFPDEQIDIFTACCNFVTDPTCLLAAADA